ncbi:GPI ethanolamine phosphate transferase 1 [Blattella germanica]|nr:GPI ethanolamine phosphate transferase 1 [Blattella germanica]
MFASIFDIYFKSPVVHGISPQTIPLEAPAKRLVLFVADGLRADTFFKLDTSHRGNAPYLRSIIEERGTWGVSHTRMPTESRPGHVALIAGLYEDPSAVAKGWKENPVEFDSVFNESRYTWSWGSPDILPMFAKGASGNHVYIDTYGSDVEDFSGKSSTVRLDTWVFNKVEGFLNYAKTDVTLNGKLHEDKVVLFLHLLGLDTAGHTHKPHSEEYKENLKVVDKGIEKMEQLIEEFFQHDDKTTYIFTADHGMTDWETETPLVAWGAGVHGPRPGREADSETPQDWKLSHKARHDVNQADIAPLMSSLIGVPVPVNSVGVLPRKYLNVSEHEMSQLMFSNARQMAAQFAKKREVTEAGTLSFLYKEYPSLSHNIEAEIKKSEELISLSLSGLDYYQNYYQQLLLTCITLAFLGWIAWLFLSMVSSEKNSSVLDAQYSNRHNLLQVIQSKLLIKSCMQLSYNVQMLPLQFYAYIILPEIIWWAVARQRVILSKAISYVLRSLGIWKLLLLITFYIIGIEILVAAFFRRFFLSIGMLGLAAWPIVFPLHRPVSKPLLASWISSCLLLAVFPLLPVVGKEPNTNLVALSGLIFLVLAVYCAWYLRINRSKESCIIFMQLLMLVIAIWDLLTTAESVKEKQGLLWINQIISWLLLVTSLWVPMLGSKLMLLRLYSVGLALIVPFLLLSASHEGLFVLVLMLNMLCWLCLELKSADAATIKLFYIFVSFFGTGNIASINSFDPTWVHCFLTVFSPFTMTLLILWKVMIPFLGVTCTFRALNIIVQVTVVFLVLLYGLARLLTDFSLRRTIDYEKCDSSLDSCEIELVTDIPHLLDDKQHFD